MRRPQQLRQLLRGLWKRAWSSARAVRDKVHVPAVTWGKPALFTEIGYTTRPGPALRPWEWPDAMSRVKVDEAAQSSPHRALLEPMLDGAWGEAARTAGVYP